MTINHKKENFSRLEISKKNRVPIIFSSPHSGKKFTNEFLEEINCSPSNLFFLEDKYVDELYKGSSTYGISKIDAIISRAVIDLNRGLSDLDHNLIENVPSIILDSIKTSYLSKYVRSGIGLIPKINQFNKEIYSKKINWKLIKDRIDKFYTPWHTSLKRMIDENYKKYNFLLLIDCHSMPPNINLQKDYDIVLGDNFGKTCDNFISEFIKSQFEDMNYFVGLNEPYAGGYITNNYSDKSKNIHCIQIEINRDLYMNRKTLKKNDNFIILRKNLNLFMKNLSNFIVNNYQNRIAAE